MSFFQACALPNVQLYSLQKGDPVSELTSLPRGGPIIDLSPHLKDFADTAAAVDQLDLVIMTDSAVAHLPARWARRFGCCWATMRIGFGCSVAATRPGIRQCACFAPARREIGSRF